MVTRKSQRRQDKMTREREDLVRRSPIVSVGAKLLWIELVRGWAWNDDTCFPGQEALAEALGVGTRSIQRWSAELRGHGLIEVRKTPTGNFYSLAKIVPAEICAPDRLINRTIVAAASSNCENYTSTPSRQSGGKSDANLASGNDPVTPNRREPSRQSGAWGDANLADEDEYFEDENREDEKSTGATSRAGESAGGNNLDELLSEDNVVPSDVKRRKRVKKQTPPKERSKRSAKKALVGIEGSLAEAHRKAVAGSKYTNATPPPPESPRDLLELLRSEIREKYGDKAARALDSDPTGKDSKSCNTTILSKFTPDVVMKMVRVLVWDWEMVRTQYPPAPLVKHPRLEHLVRYRAILSTSVDSGVDYDQKLRGNPKSYANKFLDDQQSKYDKKIDPY